MNLSEQCVSSGLTQTFILILTILTWNPTITCLPTQQTINPDSEASKARGREEDHAAIQVKADRRTSLIRLVAHWIAAALLPTVPPAMIHFFVRNVSTSWWKPDLSNSRMGPHEPRRVNRGKVDLHQHSRGSQIEGRLTPTRSPFFRGANLVC